MDTLALVNLGRYDLGSGIFGWEIRDVCVFFVGAGQIYMENHFEQNS